MRIKGIIGFIVVNVLLSVFGFFCAEGMTKSVIESLGSSVVGAKVELADVKISFTKLSLKLEGLQVTDSDDYMKNLVEVREIRFQLGLTQLLEKKISIEDTAIEGIRVGTTRKTSGKLSEEDESFLGQAWSKGQNMISDELQQLPARQMLKGKEKVDVSGLVDPVKLTAPAEFTKTQTLINTNSQNWNDSLNKLNVTTRAAAIKQQLATVNLKEKDVRKLKKELKKVKKINKNIKTLKSQVDKTTTRIRTDYKAIEQAINNVEQAKENDYQAIVSKLDMKNVDKSEMAQLVFGPVWMDRANDWLYWLDKYQKFMPTADEKEKKAEAWKRIEGTTIAFPKEKSYPAFFLKKALLSAGGAEGELTFQGQVTDISSDPVLTAKPIVISAQGKNPDFTLAGNLDHTGPVSRDTFDLNMTGIDLKDFSLGKSSLLPGKIASGQAEIKVNLVAEGEELTLDIIIRPRDLIFNPADIPEGDAAKEIVTVLTTASKKEAQKPLKISGTLSGRKGERLKLKLDSNIDQLLMDRLKKMLQTRVDETKKMVKQRIDQLINQPKKQLMGQFNQKKGVMEGLIASKKSALTEVTSTAKNQVSSLEKRIKKQGVKRLKDKFKLLGK
ncbi:MAG: TIGR03545 family protein [Planctomycetes bacterium]|nr:TIGR03545 family protein [Planctomycetota bacterium]